jgi:hypothetical protein
MKLKEIVMVTIVALAFMLITGVAKSDDKTITPQEFVTSVSEVPKKVSNFVQNEVSKTKEYQTKVWANQKVKNAEMWNKLKSLFKGNNDS